MRTRGLILEIVLSVIVAECGSSIAASKPSKRRWPKDMPPPPAVGNDQWAGFIEHRKAKRNQLTSRAYDLLVGKLARLSNDEWPPGRIIDTIVERGWLSFEIDWLKKISETGNGKRTFNDRPSAWSAGDLAPGEEPASLDDG